jgi:hypothetical protein
MDANITLSDYRKLSKELPFLEPFDECCGSGLVNTLYVEPMIKLRGSRKWRWQIKDGYRTLVRICQVSELINRRPCLAILPTRQSFRSDSYFFRRLFQRESHIPTSPSEQFRSHNRFSMPRHNTSSFN